MDIKIRPLEKADAFVSYKWRNDKDVFNHTVNIYDKVITLEDELSWIVKILDEKDSYRCAILVDNIYVGNIYLTDIQDGKAQYHIFIGNKDYWGKGIAFSASQLLLKYAKEKLNLSMIYSYTRKLNQSSLQLHKKIGFDIVREENELYYLEIYL